jgi:hypothetical protein
MAGLLYLILAENGEKGIILKIARVSLMIYIMECGRAVSKQEDGAVKNDIWGLGEI